MENERKDLERQRQQLFADRLTFQRAFSELDEKTLRELQAGQRLMPVGGDLAAGVGAGDKQLHTL
jgi:hypothetical protein